MRLLFVSVPWLPRFPTVREGLANHGKETWETILGRTRGLVNARPWLLGTSGKKIHGKVHAAQLILHYFFGFSWACLARMALARASIFFA